MNLLVLALAPVIIIAFYIYFRDKYEKEPIKILLFSLLAGALTTIPILFVETFLDKYSENFEDLTKAAYDAFVVAAFTEEFFKYLALFLLIWNNKNFNENFDGIVYAVFISLGFASVENVLYVVGDSTYTVGVMRAVTAVPAHALFGVAMGYHFSMARFVPNVRSIQLALAFLVPVILHGIYDFILMADRPILLLLFVPYVIFLWILGFRRMKSHSDSSVFKDEEKEIY